MDVLPRPEAIAHLPCAFVTRRGEELVIATLDDERCQALIEMYLAYEPKASFQGLPPARPASCVRWVQHVIRNGINLIVEAGPGHVVGHAALFPIGNQRCEMLVAVAPSYQNQGIGTELTRASLRMAEHLGFLQIWLPVEASNSRARQVYKKCGFRYLFYDHVGEAEMVADVNRLPREAVRKTYEGLVASSHASDRLSSATLR